MYNTLNAKLLCFHLHQFKCSYAKIRIDASNVLWVLLSKTSVQMVSCSRRVWSKNTHASEIRKSSEERVYIPHSRLKPSIMYSNKVISIQNVTMSECMSPGFLCTKTARTVLMFLPLSARHTHTYVHTCLPWNRETSSRRLPVHEKRDLHLLCTTLARHKDEFCFKRHRDPWMTDGSCTARKSPSHCSYVAADEKHAISIGWIAKNADVTVHGRRVKIGATSI